MQRHSLRICLVGPNTRFLSGITYHTYSLCNVLSERFTVSAILMNRLIPARLYPGKQRVGTNLSNLQITPEVARFDGIDWFWIPSLLRALWFLIQQRPSVLILQWWTGAVLHSYLVLALAARLLGARIVVEFHEVQDTGEANIPFVGRYVGLVAPLLFRLAAGYTVHSEHDRKLVSAHYPLDGKPSEIVPVGSYDNYRKGRRQREAPEECCNLLYFGVIRPYKGLEDLIRAFDLIPEEEIDGYWLTVVGETWEGWTLPTELIAASRYRDRITFINRYVEDDEVEGFFGGADIVVLPYRRASQSGPLHVALNYGLPIVVTNVGGLAEAVASYKYDGAVVVEPADPEALLAAIRQATALRGRTFVQMPGWVVAADRYAAFLPPLVAGRSPVLAATPEAES